MAGLARSGDLQGGGRVPKHRHCAVGQAVRLFTGYCGHGNRLLTRGLLQTTARQKQKATDKHKRERHTHEVNSFISQEVLLYQVLAPEVTDRQAIVFLVDMWLTPS